MSNIRKDYKGRKVLNTSVVVDVDQTFDADVSILLEDVLDSLDLEDLAEILYDAGTNGFNAVAEYFPKLTDVEYEGEKLKRHLCDIAGCAYTCTTEEIMKRLNDMLK